MRSIPGILNNKLSHRTISWVSNYPHNNVVWIFYLSCLPCFILNHLLTLVCGKMGDIHFSCLLWFCIDFNKVAADNVDVFLLLLASALSPSFAFRSRKQIRAKFGQFPDKSRYITVTTAPPKVNDSSSERSRRALFRNGLGFALARTVWPWASQTCARNKEFGQFPENIEVFLSNYRFHRSEW